MTGIRHPKPMSPARQAPHQPVILIPARMNSHRLPGKPLADICGEPMIVRVWERALTSQLGPVVVACDGEEIAAVIRKKGGMAVVNAARSSLRFRPDLGSLARGR